MPTTEYRILPADVAPGAAFPDEIVYDSYEKADAARARFLTTSESSDPYPESLRLAHYALGTGTIQSRTRSDWADAAAPEES